MAHESSANRDTAITSEAGLESVVGETITTGAELTAHTAVAAAHHSNTLDHTQGTDLGLDTGGANSITAVQAVAAAGLAASALQTGDASAEVASDAGVGNIVIEDGAGGITGIAIGVAAGTVAAGDSIPTHSALTSGAHGITVAGAAVTTAANAAAQLAAIGAETAGAVATHAGLASPHADIGTNTAARHTQGTDQGLDIGGGNAVTVAAVKAAVDAVGALTLIDTADARLSDARTPNLAAPYLITGGTVSYDGTRYLNGFQDPADNTVHAIWTPQDVGAGSIVKTAGVTLYTVPNGQTSDWFGGVYNLMRLEANGILRPYSNWEIYCPLTHDGATEDQGIFLGVLFDDTDADFVGIQNVYDAGSNKINAVRGPNVVLDSSAAGATAGWVKLAFHAGVIHFLYSNNAIGSEPGDGAWTRTATYTPAWEPVNLTLFVGALNFVTEPGCTLEVSPVRITYR